MAGLDAHTKVLLHFDGTFTKDECGNDWGVAFGTPLFTIGKFGQCAEFKSCSYLFDGNESDITFNSADEWTIDFWTNFKSVSNDYLIFGRNRLGTPGSVIDCTIEGQGLCIFHIAVIPLTSLTTNTWYHVAFVNDGTSFKTFLIEIGKFN